MSDVKLGLWPLAGIVVTAVSVTAAVCLVATRQPQRSDPAADAIKSIFGDGEAWAAEQRKQSELVEQSGETGVFFGDLSSNYDVGWRLEDPPVLTVSSVVRTPAEWDVVGIAGRMDVLKGDAVLWSGAIDDRSPESSRGRYRVSAKVRYDDSNPAHRDMRHGPSDGSGTKYTVRLTATHVVFADGTVKTYDR